ELLPSAFRLICFPIPLEIEFASRACRYASQYSSIGWKREWNLRQVIDRHACSDHDASHLRDLHCPLADDVAAQYPVGPAVNDQLTETDFVPIDDRTCGGVEAQNSCLDVVSFACFPFSETDLGILGVRETADGTHRVPNRHRRVLHGVSSCNEAVPYCLRGQHQTTGNVSSGKDMGLRGPQMLINLD